MSAYHNLVCKECKKYLHCGKLLLKQDLYRIQGLFSEREMIWIDDERCWRAIAQFLIAHEGHSLVFASDDVIKVHLDPYEAVGFDQLIAEAERGGSRFD